MGTIAVKHFPPCLPPLAEEEYAAVSMSICRRIQDGTMPPDDAYWWTRVLVADAVFSILHDEQESPSEEQMSPSLTCCRVPG